MALAVTHIIITIVILDLFRHYLFGQKKFSRYLLVVGGIAGLLPDLDVPLMWLYNYFTSTGIYFHGIFTHSLFFIPITISIAAFFHYQQKQEWAKIFYVISFGLFLHLFLDCTFGGYKTFFWPFDIATNFCPQWNSNTYAAGIDAIILVIWLAHEEVHKKIKDYI